ncbi:PadR family transcriptional regulator [Gemmatimonadota bacterium]
MSKIKPHRSAGIRMTPTFFHILLSLVDGERHGYALMQEIADRTDGAIRLGPGSLYWSLNRLQETGLIEETATHPDPDNCDERRRYYRLTGSGSKLLTQEAEALAKIVYLAIAKKVIRSPGLA